MSDEPSRAVSDAHRAYDWLRIPRYLAADIQWIRSRIERGDLIGAILTIGVVRQYLLAERIYLIGYAHLSKRRAG